MYGHGLVVKLEDDLLFVRAHEFRLGPVQQLHLVVDEEGDRAVASHHFQVQEHPSSEFPDEH